jgi:hypothetical protein
LREDYGGVKRISERCKNHTKYVPHLWDRMVLLHRLADSVTVVTGAVVGLGARSPAGALGVLIARTGISPLTIHAAFVSSLSPQLYLQPADSTAGLESEQTNR